MKQCSAIVIGLSLILILAAAPAAQITTTCEFNEANQQLDYSISGAAAGTNYTVTAVVAQGCVEMATAPLLVGPSDNNSVDLICEDNQFNGYLRVEFCEQGSLCFASYEFYLYCDESCVIHERDAVPSTGPLGLAFLILSMIGIGALVASRRLAIDRR